MSLSVPSHTTWVPWLVLGQTASPGARLSSAKPGRHDRHGSGRAGVRVLLWSLGTSCPVATCRLSLSPLCRRPSDPTAPSGSPLPSASAVSSSLCSVSPKPKERLWNKSQPTLRGDDSPFGEWRPSWPGWLRGCGAALAWRLWLCPPRAAGSRTTALLLGLQGVSLSGSCHPGDSEPS